MCHLQLVEMYMMHCTVNGDFLFEQHFSCSLLPPLGLRLGDCLRLLPFLTLSKGEMCNHTATENMW